jgi:hypothetical protein
VVMSDEKHFHVSGIPWAVRSPEFTVPDFFLRGYLKDCVYRNDPHTQYRERSVLLEMKLRP